MRRNSIAATAREAARQAAVQQKTAGEITRSNGSGESAQSAGANDPLSGEWCGYGLLGFTRLGAGFLLRG